MNEREIGAITGTWYELRTINQGVDEPHEDWKGIHESYRQAVMGAIFRRIRSPQGIYRRLDIMRRRLITEHQEIEFAKISIDGAFQSLVKVLIPPTEAAAVTGRRAWNRREGLFWSIYGDTVELGRGGWLHPAIPKEAPLEEVVGRVQQYYDRDIGWIRRLSLLESRPVESPSLVAVA